MSKTKQRTTLAVSAVLFVSALILGPKLIMTGGPASTPEATCERRTLTSGQMLHSNMLTVNVYNASDKSGMANRVRTHLERNGFLGGIVGNNPGILQPTDVMILTKDQNDQKVRLLSQQFKGKVEYAAADFDTPDGLNIVLGPKFSGVNLKAKTSLKLKSPVVICVPTIDL